MRIGIDIDDTICNSWLYMLPVVSNYFKIDLEELKNKDTYYFESLNCTREEWFKFSRDHYELLATKFPLKTDVVKVINRLKEEGHEIIFITARGNRGYSDPYKLSYNYLVNNGIKFDKLIVNSENKGEICEQEKIDLFIDDSINNCQVVSSYGIDVLLFDAGCFNKKNHDFKRVANWMDVYQYIENKKNK